MNEIGDAKNTHYFITLVKQLDEKYRIPPYTRQFEFGSNRSA